MANGDIAGTIVELQNKAAEQAVLNRVWVLQRLMKNAQVSLGEQTLKLRVQRKNRDTVAVDVSEIEVSAHDAQAANRALELLGKTEEVSLFVERHEHTGKDGGPIKTTEVQLTEIERARRIAFILQRAEKAVQGEPSKKPSTEVFAGAPEESRRSPPPSSVRRTRQGAFLAARSRPKGQEHRWPRQIRILLLGGLAEAG